MPWSRSHDFLETFFFQSPAALKTSSLLGHDVSQLHGGPPQDHGDFLFGVSRHSSEFLFGSGKVPLALASVGVLAPGFANSGIPVSRTDQDQEDADEIEEEDNLKTKCVLRGLMLMLASDVVLSGVLKWNWRLPCDAPLHEWLAGCILLGFPASALSYVLVEGRPVYKYYRLTPQAGSIESITGLQFCGLDSDFDLEINDQRKGEHITEMGQTPHLLVTMAEQVAASSYRLQVARGDSVQPPRGWILEGSNNRLRWEVLHEVDSKNAWFLFQNLCHDLHGGWETDDLTGLGQSAFHRAFKAELLATAAALTWLATGTHWVSMAETCIDTAPGLWWTSFLSVVTAWSALGSGSMSLILRSIMMVMPAAKS